VKLVDVLTRPGRSLPRQARVPKLSLPTTFTSPQRPQHSARPLQRPHTRAHHDRHRIDKECCRPQRPESVLTSPAALIGCNCSLDRDTDAVHRGHPRGDERRPPASRLQRLMRTPAHSLEPLPARRVLPAVEVRGTLRYTPRDGTWVADQCMQNERHTYEKCQYEEFKQRVAKMDELRAAKNGARSN
jgi:hypothetical protein